MEDLKVISGELQGPVGLPGIELLLLHESLEIVVVSEDRNSMRATLQVMAPLLHCGNNCQQLLVVYLVVLLRGDELLQPEGYGTPMAVLILLGEHST